VAKQAALAQPDELAALLTLGNVQALIGSSDAALDSFNLALAKEPLCVEARVYLALLHLQLRRYDEARAELTRALFLEPTLALGHYLLAQAHELRGDREAARRSFRNALGQRKTPPRPLLGHYPELPESNEAIAQASQYRLAALSES
jgi:chemotaxis protein methyltransferase CheR